MSPGKADHRVILRRLASVNQAIMHLRTHAGCTAEQLQANLDLQWAVLHGLQIAIQGVLDISAHIAATEGHDVRDYPSTIDALGRLGVIEAQFARRLRSVAGFRNVLVHEYLDVDLAVVALVLNDGLNDLDGFVVAVRAWLTKSAAQS